MTKKEMFNAIALYVKGNMEAVTAEEVMEFCNKEIELLDRKKSGSSKPTKTQLENEVHKETIIQVLNNSETPLSISQIIAADESLAGFKSQKISALLTQLRKEGRVERGEYKRKAYFAIAGFNIEQFLNDDDEKAEEEA